MTKPEPRPGPPWLAAWFVELFASTKQAESMLGDLQEEFSDLASQSGILFARRWYGRQSVKTVLHLAGDGFRRARWSLAGAVLLGFTLRSVSFTLPERVVLAVLRTQRPYSNLHVEAYMRLVTYGIPIVHVIASMLVGCVVGLASKGREMVATTILALVLCALLGSALVHAATLDRVEIACSLPDPFAIVLGGVIIREIRSTIAWRLLPV